MLKREEKECGKILTFGGASCMAPEKHSEENNVCQKSHIAFNQGNIKNRRFIAYLARIYLGLLLNTLILVI